MLKQTVVTRFAPSPTGFMHVGALRTGLFAWLVAKQAGGTFILRIEDTDKNREVEGSVEHIIQCVRMLGLEYEYGPDKPGATGPYMQSQRLEIYHEWAKKMIADGRAYADPYTPEELNHFREEAKAKKQPFLYRNHRPDNPPVWDGRLPLRFLSKPRDYSWNDEVMGDLKTGEEVIDDIVLIKSDGYPTYNFAHIVDDAEMGVTHVIRGQEFISSTPNYLNIYDALSLKYPIFATMPHIMNDQGNKKLGKRDGAKDVLGYIAEGYLPETMLSFIATLGWNDGTTQEIYERADLVEKFSLKRVQKSGARFDQRRLQWMNGHFIRELEPKELALRLERFLSPAAKKAEPIYRQAVIELCQDRLKSLSDINTLSNFFFEQPTPDTSLISSHKQLKKLSNAELVGLLSATHDSLSETEWSQDAIQSSLNGLLETTGQKPVILFSIIRIAITWAPFSPELDKTLVLLGKDEALARIAAAKSVITDRQS